MNRIVPVSALRGRECRAHPSGTATGWSSSSDSGSYRRLPLLTADRTICLSVPVSVTAHCSLLRLGVGLARVLAQGLEDSLMQREHPVAGLSLLRLHQLSGVGEEFRVQVEEALQLVI